MSAKATPGAFTVLTVAVTISDKTLKGYEGKAFGSLGVALLGVAALLQILLLIKCGGDEHHPKKEEVAVAKPVTSAPAHAPV